MASEDEIRRRASEVADNLGCSIEQATMAARAVPPPHSIEETEDVVLSMMSCMEPTLGSSRSYPAAACCCANRDDAATIRRVFLEHGFVAFPGFLKTPEVTALLDHVAGFTKELPSRVAAGEIPDAHAMYDDVTRCATLKQVQHFHTHSTVIASLAQRLSALADVIMGEPCNLQNVQCSRRREVNPRVMICRQSSASLASRSLLAPGRL